MFDLQGIDWSKLDFEWLVEDIDLIIYMMQIMMIGIPILFIILLVLFSFLLIQNNNKVSRIEKHMKELKELLKENNRN
ncbi:MAG TPA: hypothetical protein K8V35_07980 [Aliicoccus persicus]|uniref:DUF4083 domain-containing protein n=1 Tax=Aliicoccus persicus TaxID=930138 RepID=A0A921DXZ8_9STAP|nr:hypothetical protein [Aliicoccus persicus]